MTMMTMANANHDEDQGLFHEDDEDRRVSKERDEGQELSKAPRGGG